MRSGVLLLESCEGGYTLICHEVDVGLIQLSFHTSLFSNISVKLRRGFAL